MYLQSADIEHEGNGNAIDEDIDNDIDSVRKVIYKKTMLIWAVSCQNIFMCFLLLRISVLKHA